MEHLYYGASCLAPPGHHEDYSLPDTLAETERLAATIEQAVWRATGGRVRNLAVQVNHKGVTLTGRCTTYYTKQQAQHAAMAFQNEGLLNNEIEVC